MFALESPDLLSFQEVQRPVMGNATARLTAGQCVSLQSPCSRPPEVGKSKCQTNRNQGFVRSNGAVERAAIAAIAWFVGYFLRWSWSLWALGFLRLRCVT